MLHSLSVASPSRCQWATPKPSISSQPTKYLPNHVSFFLVCTTHFLAQDLQVKRVVSHEVFAATMDLNLQSSSETFRSKSSLSASFVPGDVKLIRCVFQANMDNLCVVGRLKQLLTHTTELAFQITSRPCRPGHPAPSARVPSPRTTES